MSGIVKGPWDGRECSCTTGLSGRGLHAEFCALYDRDAATILSLQEEIHSLRSQVSRLEEALRPFAELADYYDGHIPAATGAIFGVAFADGQQLSTAPADAPAVEEFTVGDLRKARSLLAGEQSSAKEGA